MATVDLSGMIQMLQVKYSAANVTAQVTAHPGVVGLGLFIPPYGSPSKRLKRRWKKAGRPDSLKAFARTMTPWDEDARRWLHRPGQRLHRRMARRPTSAR